MDVPLDSLDPPSANNRIFFPRIAELADAIETSKWLEPLTVRRTKPGRWEVVAGERRLRALLLIRERREKDGGEFHWNEVPVQPINGSELEIFTVNVVENIHRSNLRCWEIVNICRKARDEFGLTSKEIAKTLQISESYVNNLLRVNDRACAFLVDTLKKGVDCPIALVINWVKLTPNVQQKKVKEWLGIQNQTGDKKSKRRRRMMAYWQAEKYLGELVNQKRTTATGAAIQVCRYLMGIKKEPPRL